MLQLKQVRQRLLTICFEPRVEMLILPGIKRILPCAFTIACPPTGVMNLRDDKEAVYQRILFHKIPYTIVDVSKVIALSLSGAFLPGASC